MCTPYKGSLVLAAHPTKGTHIPCVRPQQLGYSKCELDHSVSREDLHSSNLPFPLSALLGHTSQPASFLPFILNSLWIILFPIYVCVCVCVLSGG